VCVCFVLKKAGRNCVSTGVWSIGRMDALCFCLDKPNASRMALCVQHCAAAALGHVLLLAM
jgi:hypothetical protein